MYQLMHREPEDCSLVRLACPRCGPVRMALAATPGGGLGEITAFECPYCSTECSGTLLGYGQTTRILPYFELEAHLEQLGWRPPSLDGFRRLVPGQLVIFCQEANILHFASINAVWTNSVNISPTGVPSISFILGGVETGPIPHISGAGGIPPFWCLADELPRPDKPAKTTPSKPVAAPASRPRPHRKVVVN